MASVYELRTSFYVRVTSVYAVMTWASVLVTFSRLLMTLGGTGRAVAGREGKAPGHLLPRHRAGSLLDPLPSKSRYTATWKREFKFPWCKVGAPNHLDDNVNSDQWFVNKDVSLIPPPASEAPGRLLPRHRAGNPFFFFITLNPRVELYRSL